MGYHTMGVRKCHIISCCCHYPVVSWYSPQHFFNWAQKVWSDPSDCIIIRQLDYIICYVMLWYHHDEIHEACFIISYGKFDYSCLITEPLWEGAAVVNTVCIRMLLPPTHLIKASSPLIRWSNRRWEEAFFILCWQVVNECFCNPTIFKDPTSCMRLLSPYIRVLSNFHQCQQCRLTRRVRFNLRARKSTRLKITEISGFFLSPSQGNQYINYWL